MPSRDNAASYVAIAGATSLEYTPTAQDVGGRLRIEAVGPYGGDAVVVETSEIAVDPSTHSTIKGCLVHVCFWFASCCDCVLCAGTCIAAMWNSIASWRSQSHEFYSSHERTSR